MNPSQSYFTSHRLHISHRWLRLPLLCRLACALACVAAGGSCAPSSGTDLNQPRNASGNASASHGKASPAMADSQGVENKVSTDVDELARLVNLPHKPVSATWQRRASGADAGASRVPGPTDWSLTALLEFSEEDAARVVAVATARRPAATREVKAQDWFPEAVKKHVTGDALKGEAYDAGDFYKSPLVNGTLLRIGGTNYFVLGLYTM